MKRFSLKGAILLANTQDDLYFTRATKNALDFKSRRCAEATIVPEIAVFPYPVQKLMANEIQLARKMQSDGEPFREGTMLGHHSLGESESDDEDEGIKVVSCDCIFFRKWKLPCRHVFHAHLELGSVLDPRMIELLKSMWEDSGFELYEGLEAFVLPPPSEAVVPVKERLAAREIGELVSKAYFEAEAEAMQRFDEEQRPLFLQWVVDQLNQAVFGVLPQLTVAN